MKYFTEDQIEKIKGGYFSDVYFNRTKEILLKENNFKNVVMQIFQRRQRALLCGIEEVKELFQLATNNKQQITINIDSLTDGEWVEAFQPVMHITGSYVYFTQLETVYLGILARRTLVATNTRFAVDAAKGKPVMFFAGRFDYFLNQIGDGYAAKMGGATGVSTGANAEWINGTPVGTLPHALIAVCNGNTVKAAEFFSKHYPNVHLITLVDFENDCIKTSLEVARKLEKKLWGVRIDTAGNMVDKSLKSQISNPKSQNQNPKLKTFKDRLYGVNPTLIKLVRTALDQEGFPQVKIIVSGGFDAEKIAWFEKEKTPVDVYGVGSSLLKGNNDFTADIVKVEGKNIAKAGRSYKPLAN